MYIEIRQQLINRPGYLKLLRRAVGSGTAAGSGLGFLRSGLLTGVLRLNSMLSMYI